MAQTRSNTRPAIVTLLLAIGVGGCMPSADVSDLRQFTVDAHKDTRPEIEPIPQLEPYESFTYTGEDLVNPFLALNLRQNPAIATGGDADDVFEPARRRETLEQFPLDALSMFGTMSREGLEWALVGTPDGGTHTVTLGNHVGQQNGKIIDITEQEVVLREVVKGPTGQWVERRATLTLEQ